jgi:TetR/AcrR family transcriptional repressor of nem operon
MSQRAAQKSESKRAIVESGAILLRERGIAGASVQQVMAGAGLTVGAFYAHFADKHALVSELFARAFEQARAMFDKAADGQSGPERLAAVVERYLSDRHRDNPGLGCPLPATLGEAASSSDEAVRELLGHAVVTMRERLSAVAGPSASEDELYALLALMVGGQIIARATRGTATSSDVLAACRGASRKLVGATKGRRR